jgi:uncharacterized cupredoxin-like copper-binding protein
MRFRTKNWRAVAALALAGLLIAGAFGVATEQEAHASPVRPSTTSSSVAVTTAAPYSFVPNAFQQIATNSTINVTVTDADTLAHTFSILKLQGTVLPTSADIPALFAKYGDLISLNVTGSGDVVSGSFTSPGPGWYEFVCQEPGHFQSGMYGFIAFGMNLPTNVSVVSTNTGPGAAVFIIVGTIVSLVVIAIVLGFVVGKRHGSEFEMPPERLGYAEPGGPTSPDEPPSGGPSPPAP